MAKSTEENAKAGSSRGAPQSGARVEFDSRHFEESFGRFLTDERMIDHIVLERAVGAARKTWRAAGPRGDEARIGLGNQSCGGAFALSLACVGAFCRCAAGRILPDLIEADFLIGANL